MILKPQDTLLALKYWSLGNRNEQLSVRELADSIAISASEVSKAAKRLVLARLVVEREKILFTEKGALLEWLSFGVRYAYPLENAGYGRGKATSWNCPILESEMVPPNPALVWPAPGGEAEGAMIKPIHDSAPFAASNDDQVYRALSLLDAIRGGKPRELVIARKILATLLNGQK